jgi:hypothetical protein
MRGPADDHAVTVADTPEGAEASADEERPRPSPGGKPLLRLLQLLQSEGLTEIAGEVATAAVGPEEIGRLDAAMEAFGLAPLQVPAAPGADGGEGADSAESAGEQTGTAEVAAARRSPGATAAADLAETSAAVASHVTGPPTASGPQWRSLGPWTVTNGQTYGNSRVNVSGRISALATDPSDPAHVLAGAANGGVWESRDRGGSWQPRTDYQATLTIGALAFDPHAPATVYCGTGEGDWWSFLGNGVLRSDDGGTSWTPIAQAPFVGQGFYSLIVDRTDRKRLYAGATWGLYTSTDSGVTWTRRRSQRTWAVSAAQGGGEVLASCSDGVFRSTDGTTWTAQTLPGSPGTFDRLAVAVAPSDATVAYAWGASGGVAYLWRRAGGAWTAVGTPPGAATNQAWYDWYVAVAPDNPGEVYCGTIEVHRGNLSGGAWTWRNLTNKGAAGDSIHPDQHSIAFEPGRPATVYAGNDGGVYRSTDRGLTWTHCNNGLAVSEFEYLTHDWGSVRWLLGGTQDNGTNRFLGSLVWEHVQDGDGGDCGTRRADPNTVFHTFQNGWLERSTTKGGWGSWANITPTRPMGEGPGLFYVPFEASATTGATIALGGEALYVSRDSGTSWTRLAFPGGAGVASALAVPDADTVLVGLTDGRVSRSRWSGGSWAALTALTTPDSAYVSDLVAEPGGGGRVWATLSRRGAGRVYRSDNGGTSWADRSGNLPDLPVHAIAVDDANRERVWAAADLGVYQSWDGGGSWSDFSASLPNAYIGDLVFHPHARVLRAGTRNRGVWEVPVDGWMTQPICGVQWNGRLEPGQTQRWFTFGWPATWHMLWTVMPTTPHPGGPQLTSTTQVERADPERVTYWISVTNLTARAVEFQGRYCILSRY